VQLSFHYEYTDLIERLLDRHGITHYVRYPMVGGRDRDGKHFGSQVFPGSVTVVQAQVAEEGLDGLLEALRRFREEKPAHRHLEALVLPIERRI
jgi:hypothetical protein